MIDSRLETCVKHCLIFIVFYAILFNIALLNVLAERAYLLTYIILLSSRHIGTTENRVIFSRYLPWREIAGTAQH